MTDNEAIEVLTDRHTSIGTTKCDDVVWRKLKPAIDTAVNALEEIQQYQAIGTVEECREARERQKRRKPKVWTTPDDGINLIYDMYKCPNCGQEHKIDYYNEYSYCPNCGQAVQLFGEEGANHAINNSSNNN